MMEIVPLDPVPAQTLEVVLNEQNVQITLQQRSTGLFMNLTSNGTVIVLGVLCENLNRIVRSLYLGFSGDFTFIDNQGTADPVFSGLGERYSLAYLTPDELAGEG